MFTLTQPVDPSIIPVDSPPRQHKVSPSSRQETGWKTSKKPRESWKTNSSFYAQQRQPKPLPHIPNSYHHRSSMPTGGFMNESFHYYDQQGQDINHYPYHSDTSLQYHQYSMDQSDLYQQNHYQDNTFAYYQQPIEEYPIHTHPWQEPSEPYIEWAEPMINHNNNNNNTTPSSSNCSSPRLKEKKLNSSGRNVRQITVRSVNKEHRVWIDILPTETGISLANKIHRIATFGTRKVLKITTAHGRVIPLDPRPIFGNWMDMNTFEDGEHWQVEWGDLDKSLVDKFFSKVIQVGGKR